MPTIIASRLPATIPAMPDEERYSLASLRKKIAGGQSLPSPTELAWLLEETERLTRANRALDNELARLEAEIRQKDCEFMAVESELMDVSEELAKCREQLRQAAAQEVSSHVNDPSAGSA